MSTTIDGFLSAVELEYMKGASDRRVPIGDFLPQVHETVNYLSFYLEKAPLSLLTASGEATKDGGAPSALNFTQWSLRQYCRRIKPDGAVLAADYVKDCTPNLALANMRTWVKVNAEKEAFWRLKTDKSGQIHIRAVLPGIWSPIDAYYIGSKLAPILGDSPIEYTVTDKFWRILRWAQTSDPYLIGFRIMGSEVGAMPYVRVDTMLGFQTSSGSGTSSSAIPILRGGKPVARLVHNSSGMRAASGLADAIAKGLSQTDDLTKCLEQRRDETLHYPQDEFIDIVDDRNLPAIVRSTVSERAELFEHVNNKLDMVKLLSKLASETVGHAQIRIEEAAALYALTGKPRERTNRNDEDWEI